MSEIDAIYEVRDVTDEEHYHSLVWYPTLDAAVERCKTMSGDRPLHGDFTDPDIDDHVELAVFRRVPGEFSYPKRECSVLWNWKWSDDEQHQVWYVVEETE